MRFLHGAELTSAIRNVVAQGESKLAVAFWGGDAIELLGFPADCSHLKIICDAWSGACHPGTLSTLLKRNAQLKNLSKLHAKLYLGTAAMVVTSANASANGLAEEGVDEAGLEAGCLTDEAAMLASASQWFDTVFKRAATIEPRHIAEIRVLWKRRRSGRPSRGETSLAEAILANSPDLQDRNLKVYVYDAEKPPKSVREDFKASPAYNPKIHDSFGGESYFWGELPAKIGDRLLCFERNKSGIEFDNVWNIDARLVGREHPFFPSTPLSRPIGMSVGKRKMVEVSRRLTQLIAQGKVSPNEKPISIGAFAALVHAVTG